jgi:hypothetical protein
MKIKVNPELSNFERLAIRKQRVEVTSFSFDHRCNDNTTNSIFDNDVAIANG